MSRARDRYRLLQVAIAGCVIAALSCSSDAEPESLFDDAGQGTRVQGVGQALAVETPILPVADTFVREWDDDTNFGGLSEIRVEGTSLSAFQHGLVRFDSGQIASAVGTDDLAKAELELTIRQPSGFWGDGTITVHRMTMPWTELGATWDCANDTATWNFWTDCSLADRWGMEWGSPFPQPYVTAATAERYVSALQTGTIRLDVTADVAQMLAQPTTNRGWLIKAGHDPYVVFVDFGSRESTTKPRLIVTHAAPCPDDPTSGQPGHCGCGASDSVCNGYDGDCDGRIDEGYQQTCSSAAVNVCVNGHVVAASCDDGYMCNGTETCVAGACVPGTSPSIDDGNACTADSCSSQGGVQHVPMPNEAVCNDSNLCTTADSCTGGICAGRPVDCSAVADACNAGVCNPATGVCTTQPRANGTACNDRVACTPTDTCQQGVCNGAGNTCTAPATNCTFATFNQHSYWFCKTDQTWSQARAKCQAVGMDLVAVETADEDTFVSSHVVQSTWLGSTDAASQGNWAWSVNDARFWEGGNSGGPVSGMVANWEHSVPDWGISGDCAGKDAAGGQWETFSCSTSRDYVCETSGLRTGEVCDDDSAAAGPPRRDLLCSSGLVCGRANGAGFGEPEEVGVCWPPTCENGIKDPSETNVDCGGPCGSCNDVCPNSFCRQGQTVLPAPVEVLPFSIGTFTRSTAATYQVGADRVDRALANRLRYEDRGDGNGRVGLFEGARTNVLRWSESLAESPWTPPTGTLPMLLTFGVSTPDDGTPTPELHAEAGAGFSPSQVATAPAGAATVSVWQRLSPFAGRSTGASRLSVLSTNNATVYGGGQDSPLAARWTRMDTPTAPTASAKVVFAHKANFPTVGQRALPEIDFDVWGMQWESGRFPSSYIRTDAATATRAPDVLTYTSAQVPSWMRTGRWQVDVYPEFASNEMDAGREYMLVSFGGATNGVLLVDGKVRVRVGGANRLDRAATWKRHAKLTLTVDAIGSAISIRGADTGNGTFAVAAFSFPSASLRVGGTYGVANTEAFSRISELRRVSGADEACAPSAGHCTADCPCDEGEGGCAQDNQCLTGLTCVPNAGARHGLPAAYGVCEHPGCSDPNIAAGACGTVNSPCGLCGPACVPSCAGKSCGTNGCGGSCGPTCGRGEGGAESDADCDPGLVLGVAMGAQFDLPPAMNVCVPSICTQLRPELLPCGTLSDPCGKCPVCEPHCDGRSCGDDGCGGSCGTCPFGSCAGGDHCVQLLSPPQHQPPAGTDLSTAPVGTLPGSFVVNHAGEATYAVPLVVPPGRGGVQPNLSLTYNSNRDNGFVGLGWAVEGFSSIARCNRTVAIDGFARAPDFLPSDAMCLDGNRLVPTGFEVVSATSPGFAITYRLENDQYMLVRGYFDFNEDESLVGPFFFRAWTKDGRILEYGNSPDSNAVVFGPVRPALDPYSSQVTTWLLNQVSDRTNNTMNVQYVHRSRGSTSPYVPHEIEFYPRAITYGPIESPIAVQFAYDFDRPNPPPLRVDARAKWHGGTKVHVDHLLDRVEIQLNGNLFRSYKVGYDSGTGHGEANLLNYLQQCDADDVCMPATSFQYDIPVTPETPVLTALPDPVVPGSDITDLVPSGADYGEHNPVGQPLDLNGDGIDDFLYQVVSYYNGEDAPDQQEDYVALMSNGTVGAASHSYVHTGITSDFMHVWTDGLFGWSQESQTQRATVAGGALGTLDYNNDGRQDVLTAAWIRSIDSSNYRVLSYNGTGFDFIDTGIHYDHRRPGQVFVADADGDGYQDMVRCLPDPNEWYVYFNVEGRGFNENTKVVIQSDAPCTRDSLAIDSDGDGRDEILIKLAPADPEQPPIVGTVVPSMLMYIGVNRDGQVAFLETQAQLGDYASLYKGGPRSKLIDINGDGLSDVLGWSIKGEMSDHMAVSISISHGDGIFDVRYQTLQFGTSNIDTLRGDAMALAQAVDVDRDGRQDLIASSWAGGNDTFLSTGEMFAPGVNLGLFNKPIRDYDRDGYKEPGVLVAGTPKPKLRMVMDGYGAKVGISYGLISDPAVHHDDRLASSCQFPFICRLQTGPVVASHNVDEGPGGRKSWVHRYDGARTAALGRGFLGFGTRAVAEYDGAEIISTTTYDYDNRTRNDLNAFPFAFLPFAKVKATYLADGTYVQSERRTYESTFPVHGVNPLGRTYGTDVAVPKETRRDRYTMSDRGIVFLSIETEEIVDFNPVYGNVLAEKDTLSSHETRLVTTSYKHLSQPSLVEDWLIDLPSAIEDRYVYQGKQEVAKRTDFGYDANGKMLLRAEDTGLLTSFTYNDHGGVETETAGSFEDGIRTRTLRWDDLDEYPVGVTDSLGHETTMEYDRRFGRQAWSQDPNGLLSVSAYDNFGRLKATFAPTGASSTISYHPGTPALPLIVERDDADGARRVTKYDPGTRPVEMQSWDFTGKELLQTVSYDARGRVSARTVPTVGASPAVVTALEYDNLDRVVAEYGPDGTSKSSYQDGVACIENGRGMTRCSLRDDRGRIVRVTDPVELDSNLALLVWPSLTGTTYTYQAFDVLDQIVDQKGNRTAITIDSHGRKTASSDPDRGNEAFVYNAFNEVRQYTNGNGETSSFVFDSLGRKTERRDWAGAPGTGSFASTTWEWDGGATLGTGELIGALTHTSSPDGIEVAYRYGARGLPEEETISFEGTTGTESYKTTRTWDDFGRPSTVAFPAKDGVAQFVAKYEYAPATNHSDALVRISNGSADYGNEVYWHATTTDDHGRLTGETMGNGSTRSRSWYVSGRLQSMTTRRADLGILQDVEYFYDGAGNLDHEMDRAKGRPNAFSYDAFDRLLEEQTTSPGSYQYDAIGNLVQAGFKYENDQPRAISSDGQFGYHYDDAGRRISKTRANGSGLEIDYTRFGLPQELRTLGAGGAISDVMTLSYDAAGRRVRKVTEEGERVYAGGFERQKYADGRPTEQFFYVSNGREVVAQIKATIGASHSTAYLHASRMGTVNFVEDGATVTELVHDAFGRPVSTGGSAADPWSAPSTVGFGGHEMDAEVELVNMSGRVYDPATRQFLTPDPIIGAPFSALDLHPYGYAWSNPLRYSDPTGLDENDDYQAQFTRDSVTEQTFGENEGSVITVQRSLGEADDGLDTIRAAGGDSIRSPLSSRGFGERAPFESWSAIGEPNWAAGQVRNVAYFTAGVVAAGVVASAAASEAAVLDPESLLDAPVCAVVALWSYDYDAVSEWGSKFYGNELSVSELLTAGFVVGATMSGLRATTSSAAARDAVGIATPFGRALQSTTAEAAEARVAAQSGATLYRSGVLGSSSGPEAQFWSLENPLNPGYAAKYGLPPESVAFDFVETATLKSGASFITREAPGILENGGGAIEVVVNPGGVSMTGFSMP
jgi:RHS repeat-associated protein